MPEPDYRSSHQAADCPLRFDGHYTHGTGRLYWEEFERPYLQTLFARFGDKRDGRYLDFACGTGRILQLGEPHFRESVGIDVSEVMLREAARRVPAARFVHADVMVDPPDVGQFTVISLFRFVLSAESHLRDGVLRWLRSVLAADGVLVLNNHLNRHSLIGMVHRLDHARHGRTGPPAESDMERLLDRCGFAIHERYGFGVIPPWRQRRFIPSSPVLRIEHLLGRSETLQRFAKDRVYVCRPI